ncbi:MAG: hypothetical protein ACFFEF_12370, partial [Candidatus Thorarchaeota archaeon]
WKKKGFGRMLLEACVKDAKEQGLAGVAMVANDGTWVTGKKLLVRNGFELVDTAPMGFELVIKKFRDAPNPKFPTDWDVRAKRCGKGFTIFYTAQCPYQPDAVRLTLELAKKLGSTAESIELKSAKEVQELSPSAYGVFAIVYDGKLLSYTYLKKEDLLKRIQS